MKQIRKMTAWVLFVCLLVLSAGCAFAEHTHTPSLQWDRNDTEHWRSCECGEKLEASAHVMEEIFCTICGSEIWTYEDGTVDIYDYYENGDLRRNTFYDADGSVIGDYRYEYGYDDQGCLMWSKTYMGDMLAEETEYSVNAYGESVIVVQTGYNEDGTWGRNDYDEYGNISAVRTYDAENVLVFEELYEYSYDADGMITETRTTARFDDGSGYASVDNQYGDRVSYIMYEADGSVLMESTTEIGYDDMGNKLWYKSYSDGVLVGEATYAMHTDEAGSWSYEQFYTEYLEDGSKIVTEYDYEGGEVSQTQYDPEGNVVEITEP